MGKTNSIYTFNSFGYISRSGIAESCGNSNFDFLLGEPPQRAPVYIPTNSGQGSNFFTSSPTFIFCIVGSSHSNGYVILIGIFLMISDAEHLFTCLWQFVYLLWRIVYSSPLPIFKPSNLSFCCDKVTFLMRKLHFTTINSERFSFVFLPPSQS